MADKDINLKIKADTREAKRNLREMERQVDKLGDLADQGERRQSGFLSSKQVQMYKRILREMESAHNTYQKRLEKTEEAYSNRKNSSEIKRLKQLEAELKKRQQLLRNAEGGNKWGDQASPIIQEYHRNKFEQASQALDAHKKSSDLKEALTDVSQLEAELTVLRAAVQRMQNERARGSVHAGRIDQMHELDPRTRRAVNGAVDTAVSAGAIMSWGGYFGYTTDGIDLLRQQERATNSVALQGGYPVGGQIDGELRRANYKLGEAQYFDTFDTAMHQKAIISGGTTGNLDALHRDTTAVQRFGRAYDIDPNQVAGGGAMLQRMGTLKEGEQQRFANLIAGAISKNGMSGRQEEMLRATVSLAQSVSQGQAMFSMEQLQNVMGLQTALGDAVPELKGERGANLLSNMDSAIKNGDHQLDLMMGKGVEFTGLEGMNILDEQQEKGISDPRNIQLLLKHSGRMFGGNKEMQKRAFMEKGVMSLSEYRALDEAGFFDKIMKDPNSISGEDLRGIGAPELAKQWDKYANSETAQVDKADSRGRNLNGSHAQVADEAAKFGRNSLWHDLPDPIQHGLLVAGGVGLGTFGTMAVRRGLTNGTIKRFASNIGGQGGWRTWFNKGGGNPPTPPVPPPGGGTAIPSNATMGAKLGQGFSNMGTGTLNVLKSAGKAVPIAGALLGTGIDQMANPENSLGRSVAKGIGGAVGGLLGGAAGVASGLFTGGLGWLGTGAMAVGGGMLGEKAGDSIYSLFAGKEDKVPTDQTATPAKTDDSAAVDKLDVNKLNINNKDLSSYFEKQSSNKDTSRGEKPREQVVRIVVEGGIEGMDSENQKEVKDSIKDYFSSAFDYSNNPFRLNLSLDQTRS